MDYVVSAICGAFFGLLLVNDDVHLGAKQSLEQCELNLPRTEKCVLIAVPESTQGKVNEQN